jgi:hypothetical protein
MEPIAYNRIVHITFISDTHTLSRTKLSETDAQAAAYNEGISPITHLMRVHACGPSCGCGGTAGCTVFGPSYRRSGEKWHHTRVVHRLTEVVLTHALRQRKLQPLFPAHVQAHVQRFGAHRLALHLRHSLGRLLVSAEVDVAEALGNALLSLLLVHLHFGRFDLTAASKHDMMSRSLLSVTLLSKYLT